MQPHVSTSLSENAPSGSTPTRGTASVASETVTKQFHVGQSAGDKSVERHTPSGTPNHSAIFTPATRGATNLHLTELGAWGWSGA